MELQDIYFISEIVAAAAVIASLVYVGIQLRQNTLTVKVAAGQAHVDAYDNLIDKIVSNDSMMESWAKSAENFDILNTVEQVQALAFVGVMFRNFEGAFVQWTEGVLDKRLWQGISRSMADQYAHEAVRVFWSLRKHWFSDEFSEWYDANVASKSNT